MRGKITWVVVADGQRAAVFHNDGPGKGLQAVEGLGGARSGARSHDMVSDKPGRMQGFAGASGAASMTARTDPHELEEARFTEHLAGEINQAALEKRFDRLILAAPPRTLGILRQALSRHATERVVAELDKDLTKSDPADLAGHLEKHLAV